MKRNSLDLLVCPACHAPLTLHDGTAGPLECGRVRGERGKKCDASQPPGIGFIFHS